MVYMREVVLKFEVPEDLARELEKMESKEISLIASSILMERFSRLVRLARLFEKSKLSKKKAEEFAERFNERLCKRYEKLYKERFG